MPIINNNTNIKFKTGETVIVKGFGEGIEREGELAIIIATKSELINEYRALSPMGGYDYYSTYSQDRNQLWWYHVDEIESYCTNTERGKSILRNFFAIDSAFSSYYGSSFDEVTSKRFRVEKLSPNVNV